jgi:ribosomal protein L37AE/L43A
LNSGLTVDNSLEMAFDPHLAGLFAGSFGVAILMTLAGVQKSALEWKQRRRICPSCGRDLRSRCACH